MVNILQIAGGSSLLESLRGKCLRTDHRGMAKFVAAKKTANHGTIGIFSSLFHNVSYFFGAKLD